MSAGGARTNGRRAPSIAVSTQLTRWRRWVFPLATMTIVPAFIFLSFEAALRVIGYGYPTSFFVEVEGSDAYTTNQKFGWRFFPRAVARSPSVSYLSETKASDAYRIFVLGGSAAMGTPNPSFGFSRFLEVMLGEAYPGVKFEVVNAAMTAINSHVALEIARDCTRHQPDLFLVYLGNNEVVGPYGPGTVFQGFSPSLRLIRLGTQARTIRTGQLLGTIISRFSGREGDLPTWRGMEMFVGRPVPADDPRLEKVYDHFRQNLVDLADVATRAGAGIVLSTVPTGLKDSPPFASVHRDDLTEAKRARWEESHRRGAELQAAGQPAAAVNAFLTAASIDDRFAELHFRLALAYLSLDRSDEAQRHFVLARDLDALRFRADSRLNEIIRQIASGKEERRIYLLDAERRLAEAPETPHHLLGNELFYEHVHLSFDGNYRLARVFLDQLETSLPEWIRKRASGRAPPSVERCAELLARTDWDRYEAAKAIYDMTNRPPFTNQLDHDRRKRMRQTSLVQLRARSRETLEDSERIYREAIVRRPEDLRLRVKFAALLEERRKFAEATEQWRTLLTRVPGVPAWRTRLGFALADQGELTEAAVELREVIRARPRSAPAYVNLGTVLEKRGELAGAIEQYRQALDLEPSSVSARCNLGYVFEKQGRLDKAVQEYREALRVDPQSAAAHFRLGAALEQQADLTEAAEEYRRALRSDPGMAKAHNNLGFVLERQGRIAEAMREYGLALQSDPGLALAHFNLADALFAQSRVAEAVESYRAGLRIKPDHVKARYNLAGCLQILNRAPEAVEQFRLVLRQEPDNPGALQNLAWILATEQDPALGDGAEAVRLAERASQLTEWQNPEILETLAVAYGANGQHEKASRIAASAIEVARAQGNMRLARTLADRLKSYEAAANQAAVP